MAGAPVFLAPERRGFGRATGRPAASRDQPVEIRMETTRISLCVHIRRVVEVVAPPNHIGEKRRRTSDVTRFVRAGCRRCLRVAVADRRDQCASPDRLRTSRYASFHDIFIVSLSEKNQHDVSVRVV